MDIKYTAQWNLCSVDISKSFATDFSQMRTYFLCFVQYLVSSHSVQFANADASLIKISYELLN